MNKAKIERWHFASWPHESYMVEEPDGEWVSYTDYADLEKHNQSLSSENAALKSAIEDHSISYHNCSICGEADPCSEHDVCMVLNSIPATLQALNEQQAQGVDRYIELKLKQLARMNPETYAFVVHITVIRQQISEMQIFAASLRNSEALNG
ncbi:hypothetical protein ABU553_003736 [Yersinia enterocolitica]